MIENSFSTASAFGGFSGGLVGWAVAGSLDQTYAGGHAIGSNAGGLVGVVLSGVTIENSYAIGFVNGSQPGGLVGVDGGGNTYANDYWDTETTGQTSSAGTAAGLTTAQMQGTFANMPGFASPTWSTGAGNVPVFVLAI